ncbi:hypothetical protein J4E85_002071 [Alternaria conjuncta]|uniref:uncharacterized protein n=1 Tax=Alternaria conjuncta TaxID=181017 RepID=UPI0022205181|nr:uncharacterized protein J4E85_002071 [Alternaria conjuncta]KAI4934215.1 hypothetical protein J4E85_002071 [Alternaria conjuncta]
MFRALQKAGEDVSVSGNAPWKDFTAMDLAQALVACRNKRIDQGLIEGTRIIGGDYERKPRSISSTKKKDILRIHTAPAKEPEPISKRESLFILRSLHSHLKMIKNAAIDEAETSQHGSLQAGVDGINAFVNPYPELCSTPGFELEGAPPTGYRIIFDSSSKPIISGKAQMLVRTVLHHQHELVFYHQQRGEMDRDKRHYLACLKEVYYIQRSELWREMMKSVEAIVNDTFVNVDDLQRYLGMVDFRKAATNVR